MVQVEPTPCASKSEEFQPRLGITGSMITHNGAVRRNNEDKVLYTIPKPGPAYEQRGALMLVADGMGGHAAGEIASAIAAETVSRTFQSLDGAVPEVLAQCFDAANQAVYQYGFDHPDCAGLGTTCTVLVLRHDCAFLGHVGDSRAYVLREGGFRQLSTDHTLIGELMRSGAITPDEAATNPNRNVIVKALGVHPHVAPEIWEQGLPLLPEDRFVLCSDGLTDLVSDVEIATAIAGLQPDDACNSLIETALRKGGHDNVSVGVFHVAEQPSVMPEAAPSPTRRIVPSPDVPERLARLRRELLRVVTQLTRLARRECQHIEGVQWTRPL